MNTFQLILESYNVINPFKLRSDPCRQNSKDKESEIVSKKFKTAIDSIENERLTVEKRIEVKYKCFTTGSLIDFFWSTDKRKLLRFILVVLLIIEFFSQKNFTENIVINKLINDTNNSKNHLIYLRGTLSTLFFFAIFEAVLYNPLGQIITAMKNWLSAIQSEQAKLNELKIRQVKLNNGFCDFILIGKRDGLIQDATNYIGQSIFELATTKNNPPT